MSDFPELDAARRALVETGRLLGARGWTPATSSNFSVRLDASHALVTVSGRDKARLGTDDLMVMRLDGTAVDPALRPSAEAPLHLQLYRLFPGVGAVLHTHSRTQTVASRLHAAAGELRLAGWELQKAIRGQHTHEAELVLPVFANSQDMAVLERAVEAWLGAGRPLDAYLIDGHGIYAWGADLPEALRHLEALEFMLGCELDLRRLEAARP